MYIAVQCLLMEKNESVPVLVATVALLLCEMQL